MVASVSALTSSAQAASYYEADDYYAEGGLAPSQWQGQGAAALGLAGEVDRAQFHALLDGQVAGQQLGTMRGGNREHRPGWDITLSAPKSVSIMAEVAGDRRLIAAHGAAVQVAMAHVEQHMAATRTRENGQIVRDMTRNLVIASFQHHTSRAQDPQLHTHNVVMNATQDADGAWRSLEPRAIYQLQKQIGAIYRQELAVNVRALGYDIEVGKDSLFEIRGVASAVLAAFSTRSAEIEARLGERGTSRGEASAAEKQMAALDTRAAKSAGNHAALVAGWRLTADKAGFGPATRQALVAEAQARAASPAHQVEWASRATMADRAVAQAADKLGERQSVFSAAALQEEAGRFGLGKVGHAEIATAVQAATRAGQLIDRTYLDRRGAAFSGFTTRQNVAIETRMLKAEFDGRGVMAPIASPLAAAKAVARAVTRAEWAGFAWNAEQRAATQQLLSSANRITALQGYAGTAKTTTVLATFAREAEAHGVAVIALAPTASAAMVLGEALGTSSETVARHLLSPQCANPGQPAAWIVDEASLLSARDTARLFDLAQKENARVVLVGDVQQLGSVEAGAAFAQLQGAGMETARLSEIVRQSNAATREAVIASIEGDARAALAALDRGGGRIVENADLAERFTTIAAHYAGLDKAARARTLVIEPSREGRDALTATIRDALARAGALTGPAVMMQSLLNKGLTRAEARDPLAYDQGDVVRFTRDYADKGVVRGEAYRVAAIDPVRAAITLQSEDGRDVDWRLRQWGTGNSQAFAPRKLELKVGDRIQFTRNDREAGRINGGRAEVIAVDELLRSATIRTARGRTEALSLDAARDQHIRHGYVDTAFAAQGRTADHVLIHADSKASNLVDQKSFYVGISRARSTATVFTNDRDRLIAAISERAGQVQTAVAQMGSVMPAPTAARGLGAGLG
ncbi:MULTISPECIES: MobF family relaxase [unclassified Novosphingobium]|uniref:MobF family relaxase n=1 Tax=unclassified Novosphingobium TaxID=2644732 RepID=UPI00146AEC62|nr:MULTISPECIES: MobF family relaxase [unclassified Novosphingobium]NMN06461.1 conjugative relaxase-like TrwC/TraI family protein [Novosphingobium sp. SG919]NMN89091.1 conjugative relaxase-like TrwC/TraI family protein [Novosphingobium sp. SG916]